MLCRLIDPRLKPYLALLVGAIVIVACAPAAVAPETVAETTPTPEPADPRLTTLFIGVSTEPQTFDPHVNVAAVSGYRFYPGIYESLIQWAPDGSLEPMLAESWEVMEDGLLYRFKLREDVLFSDGTPFNAEAVKFAFDRFFALGEGFQTMLSSIEEVSVVDEYTVDIRLGQPFAPILSVLASWQSAIYISPSAVEQNEVEGDSARAWLNENTAGTGRFVLESWEPENRIVYVRNPHYREAPDPDAIQRVVFQIAREPATMRQLLEAGELDIAEEIVPSLVDPLRAAEGIEVGVDVTHGSSYGQAVEFNITKEPFNDVNFRRAVASSINYDRLLDVWEGIATRAQGPFPDTFTPWFSAGDVVQYEQDLDRAAEFLAEAGFSAPIDPPLTFEIFWQAGQTTQRDMAELIREDLAQIGIELEIVETELPVWREAIWTKEFDLAFVQLPLRYNDPDSFATLSLVSSEIRYQGWNPGYSNPRVDEIIEIGRSELDETVRIQLYNELQNFATDEVAILFLVNKLHAYAYGSNVTGIEWNPNYGPHFLASEITKTGQR